MDTAPGFNDLRLNAFLLQTGNSLKMTHGVCSAKLGEGKKVEQVSIIQKCKIRHAVCSLHIQLESTFIYKAHLVLINKSGHSLVSWSTKRCKS